LLQRLKEISISFPYLQFPPHMLDFIQSWLRHS